MSRKTFGIKKANTEVEYSKAHAKELARCIKDPIYFINTFVKDQHAIKGMIPLTLFDFQEEMIKMFLDNKRVIIKSARQSGKCCFFTTLINTRTPKTSFLSKLMLRLFKL